MDKTVRLLDVEVAFGIKEVFGVDFHEKLTPECSQLSCLPQSRSSVRVGFENLVRNISCTGLGNSNTILVHLCYAVEVDSPLVGISLVHGVDELEDVHSD